MNADTTTLYSVRLSGPITDTGQRLEIARIIAPKLKITGEQAEKLLSKTGNLLKPANLDRATKFLEMLHNAGANAHMIELTPQGEPAMVTPAPSAPSISVSVPAVVAEPVRALEPAPTFPSPIASDPFSESVRTLDHIGGYAPQPQSSLDSFAALEAALGLSPATSPAASAAPVLAEVKPAVLDWPPPAEPAPKPAAHTLDADVLDLSAYLEDEDDDTQHSRDDWNTSRYPTNEVEPHTMGFAQGDPESVWNAGPIESDEAHHEAGALTQLDLKKTYSATIEDRFGQKPQGWLSLRWKLLPLALVPTVVLGLVWLFTTLTSQARTSEGLLLRGTAQTATLFSRQALTGIAGSGQALEDPVVLSILQSNVTDFFKSKSLPLESVAVTNAKGKIVAVYSNSFDTLSNPQVALENAPDTFSKISSESNLAMQTMAAQTSQYKPDANTESLAQAPSGDNPIARQVNADGIEQYLMGRPLENGLGSVILSINADSIKTPVRQAVLSTLIILAATLLLVGVVASYFAERLAQRVRKLATSADQISLGGLDEKIETGGLDEIGDLAQAVDRMRLSLESAMRRMRRS